MISNISKNCMGTTSFDGKFEGMRKAKDFIVYPMKTGEREITIQSDVRIGTIDLETGQVKLSKHHSGGAYFVHLYEAAPAGKLSGEQLLMLKAHIMGTASGKAGTNSMVFTDNSGALEVFG